MLIEKSENIEQMISVWNDFLKTVTWQELTHSLTPIVNGCGLIYALPANFLDRSNEDCAIVDMRNVTFTEPHYHHNIEVYFIMQGTGIVVLGNKEHAVSAGDILFITPHTAHFTIPHNDLVMAVVNTPPYTPEDYFPLTASNSDVKFDQEYFNRLTQNKTETVTKGFPMKMRKFLQNKLWRDKLPDVMKNMGSVVHTKQLTDAEYDQALRTKLLEEAEEVNAAQSKEELMGELADLYEVIDSIIAMHNISKEEIITVQNEKRSKRGGFSQNAFITIAEHAEGSFGEQYCLAQPEKYPEVE